MTVTPVTYFMMEDQADQKVIHENLEPRRRDPSYLLSGTAKEISYPWAEVVSVACTVAMGFAMESVDCLISSCALPASALLVLACTSLVRTIGISKTILL